VVNAPRRHIEKTRHDSILCDETAERGTLRAMRVASKTEIDFSRGRGRRSWTRVMHGASLPRGPAEHMIVQTFRPPSPCPAERVA
jgi:hypothetical protein